MLPSTLAFSPRFCYFPRGRSFPGCTRMNRYATAGMVMLLVLMAFITYQDIFNPIIPR